MNNAWISFRSVPGELTRLDRRDICLHGSYQRLSTIGNALRLRFLLSVSAPARSPLLPLPAPPDIPAGSLAIVCICVKIVIRVLSTSLNTLTASCTKHFGRWGTWRNCRDTLLRQCIDFYGFVLAAMVSLPFCPFKITVCKLLLWLSGYVVVMPVFFWKVWQLIFPVRFIPAFRRFWSQASYNPADASVPIRFLPASSYIVTVLPAQQLQLRIYAFFCFIVLQTIPMVNPIVGWS